MNGGFQSFHAPGLITSIMSSGHPWLFQWAKEGKLFYLQPLYYSLYICDLGYLQVFEMSGCLQGVCDLLQHLEISAKSLGQLRNWPQCTCDVFSAFIQLPVTSMMKENL